jgi:hypothetical protein
MILASAKWRPFNPVGVETFSPAPKHLIEDELDPEYHNGVRTLSGHKERACKQAKAVNHSTFYRCDKYPTYPQETG